MKDITVNINGKKITTSAGVNVFALLKKSPHKGKFPPIGAVINRRLDGLYHKLNASAEVKTIDLSSRNGMDIYRRTASLLLYASVHEVFPNAKIVVGQSLSDGYFFEVQNQDIDDVFLNKINDRMEKFVKDDQLIEPELIPVEEAVEWLIDEGFEDQTYLLKQQRQSDVQVVKLGHFCGRAYGPVAYRTGLISMFKIYPYEHGLVLSFPDENGVVPDCIPAQPKLFNTYLETKRWNTLMNVENVAQLNELCIKGEASDIVKIAEALHERKIGDIADDIVKSKNVKLVLIAGPSGSGKTTFMKRLAIQLRLHGLEPVAISLDNYYVDRKKTPRHDDGSYNFEAFDALDVELLNKNLSDLFKGKEVAIPTFSFQVGRRIVSKSKKMRLVKNEIVIMEGIHGLNTALASNVKADVKYRIFVSALTQLCLDSHNRIFTSDTRLIRRIIRDRFFRGTTAAETIAGWRSVRDGECKYIFPYQETANAVFNSALVYEHALLKPYAERFLMEVQRDHPSFMESVRLYRFFSFFIPILSREVPYTSIMREFVGGSSFRYA